MYETLVDDFWNRVDAELESRDMKLQDFSKAIGVSYTTVTAWRYHKKFLKMDNLLTIATYLDLSLDYLLTGKEAGEGIHMPEVDFVRKNPEARTLIRAVMEDPTVLYPLSALIGRRAKEDVEEKKA